MNFKSHFKFNKQERSGIFFLLIFIVVLQATYFYIKSQPFASDNVIGVNSIEQSKIDSLKIIAQTKDTIKIFPFNPNFITDYKGYTLGMSVEEIDRLHAFRAQDKYVNTKEDFKKVTGVSDSLLNRIAPYFKFPDWVTTKNKYANKPIYKFKEVNKAIAIQDLNSVTAENLKRINGIGEKLSARIIKFRDRLGGFLVDEQLYDVYGLDAEVVDRTLKQFKVLNAPEIKKININSASAEEIAALVYISYSVADRIVLLREQDGTFNSFEQLTKVEDFPSEKLDRIILYLSL